MKIKKKTIENQKQLGNHRIQQDNYENTKNLELHMRNMKIMKKFKLHRIIIKS